MPGPVRQSPWIVIRPLRPIVDHTRMLCKSRLEMTATGGNPGKMRQFDHREMTSMPLGKLRADTYVSKEHSEPTRPARAAIPH